MSCKHQSSKHKFNFALGCTVHNVRFSKKLYICLFVTLLFCHFPWIKIIRKINRNRYKASWIHLRIVIGIFFSSFEHANVQRPSALYNSNGKHRKWAFVWKCVMKMYLWNNMNKTKRKKNCTEKNSMKNVYIVLVAC